MSALPPAGWHADPFGPHQLRFWDGSRWTDHVASQGRQGLDTAVPSAPAASGQSTVQPVTTQAVTPQTATPQTATAKRVQKQVAQSFWVSGNTQAALLSEPVLVVNQKPKLGAKTEYAVFRTPSAPTTMTLDRKSFAASSIPGR